MNALLINNLNSCNIHKTLYPRFINSPKGGKQISLIHFETDFSYYIISVVIADLAITKKIYVVKVVRPHCSCQISAHR